MWRTDGFSNAAACAKGLNMKTAATAGERLEAVETIREAWHRLLLGHLPPRNTTLPSISAAGNFASLLASRMAQRIFLCGADQTSLTLLSHSAWPSNIVAPRLAGAWILSLKASPL
jgi:hypothetical protein